MIVVNSGLIQKVLEAVSSFPKNYTISVECFLTLVLFLHSKYGLGENHFLHWDVLKFQVQIFRMSFYKWQFGQLRALDSGKIRVSCF